MQGARWGAGGSVRRWGLVGRLEGPWVGPTPPATRVPGQAQQVRDSAMSDRAARPPGAWPGSRVLCQRGCCPHLLLTQADQVLSDFGTKPSGGSEPVCHINAGPGAVSASVGAERGCCPRSQPRAQMSAQTGEAQAQHLAMGRPIPAPPTGTGWTGPCCPRTGDRTDPERREPDQAPEALQTPGHVWAARKGRGLAVAAAGGVGFTACRPDGAPQGRLGLGWASAAAAAGGHTDRPQGLQDGPGSLFF